MNEERPNDVTATNLATAVRTVLHTERFAAAGRACGAEIASMPDAAMTAEALHTWLESRWTPGRFA